MPIVALAMVFWFVPAEGRSPEGEREIPSRFRADLAADVDDNIDRLASGLIGLFRNFHRHPELSRREVDTSRRVARELGLAGYQVTTGLAGTGLVGVLENGPGPVVMIRGDMDALPVAEETNLDYRSEVTAAGSNGEPVSVAHACGHDMHITNLIGSAVILAQLADRWSGTVVIVGQPAEEIGYGARAMIEEGLFERFPRPDYCLAMHVSASDPAGRVGFTKGYAFANVDSVDIKVFGRGGHGSQPQKAVDPVVMAAHVVTALQTIVSRRLDPLDPGVVTVGSIHAGSQHNIIPDDATMQLTVRSYSDESRKLLLDGIREVTTHTCRAFGSPRDPEIVVRDDQTTPSSYNDPRLVEASVRVLQQLVPKLPLVEQPPVMVGEDFGRYARVLRVPGFMFRVGVVEPQRYEESVEGGDPLPTLHSSRFEIDPEPTLRGALRTTITLALSLLEDR